MLTFKCCLLSLSLSTKKKKKKKINRKIKRKINKWNLTLDLEGWYLIKNQMLSMDVST